MFQILSSSKYVPAKGQCWYVGLEDSFFVNVSIYLSIYLSIYDSTVLMDLGCFFSFLIYTQSVGLL
jgi:hypothetical protein